MDNEMTAETLNSLMRSAQDLQTALSELDLAMKLLREHGMIEFSKKNGSYKEENYVR